MKKLLVFAICACLALTVCSCKNNGDTSGEKIGDITANDKKTVTENKKTPVPENAEQNSCGDNLTWSYDSESGSLTIEGKGEMWDYITLDKETGAYLESARPWADVQSEIKTVVIGNGVKSIGDYAFFNCTVLETVSLPEGIENIGVGAFTACTELKNIDIPASVKTIEDDAFAMCKNLAEISFAGKKDQWSALKLDSDDISDAEVKFAE